MPADSTVAENSTVAGNPAARNPAETGSRCVLAPAFILAIIWLGFLAVLDIWTANPVTVNRAQILNSQYILTARIIDPQKGIVEILAIQRTDGKQSLPSVLHKKITLQPAGIHWEENSTRIFPVSRDRKGDWFITPAPLPKFKYIDYPATDSIRREIDQILANRA